MKRLPLIIGYLIMLLLTLLAIIPLMLLWLLGANEPINNFTEFMDRTVFDL